PHQQLPFRRSTAPARGLTRRTVEKGGNSLLRNPVQRLIFLANDLKLARLHRCAGGLVIKACGNAAIFGIHRADRHAARSTGATEWRQIVAHGASRGSSVFTRISPGGATHKGPALTQNYLRRWGKHPIPLLTVKINHSVGLTPDSCAVPYLQATGPAGWFAG